jgi:hypothetical protein
MPRAAAVRTVAVSGCGMVCLRQSGVRVRVPWWCGLRASEKRAQRALQRKFAPPSATSRLHSSSADTIFINEVSTFLAMAAAAAAKPQRAGTRKAARERVALRSTERGLDACSVGAERGRTQGQRGEARRALGAAADQRPGE